MKLGKIFICINILVLSLLMSEKYYEYNRTIVMVEEQPLKITSVRVQEYQLEDHIRKP